MTEDMDTIQNLRGYNGNILLKRANQDIEWTPELIQEYVKCSQDVVYFTETYMKIINPDRGLINFELYPYQKEMLDNFQKHRMSCSVCARQSGKCFFINTPVRVRNKKTGEIYETTIGEFYERAKKTQKSLPEKM